MKSKNMYFLLITIFISLFISLFLFKFGITGKLIGNINEKVAFNNESKLYSDLPVIKYVYNSSGNKIVNSDVSLIIKVTSNYNIKKVIYSYDLKNWKVLKENFNSKEIQTKLDLKKTMNEDIYIRAINEKGYSSYAYKTTVTIDKKKPILSVNRKNNEISINAKDNIGLRYIQYSNDKINWQTEEINKKSINITKKIDTNTYVRVVDLAGNISNIK